MSRQTKYTFDNSHQKFWIAIVLCGFVLIIVSGNTIMFHHGQTKFTRASVAFLSSTRPCRKSHFSPNTGFSILTSKQIRLYHNNYSEKHSNLYLTNKHVLTNKPGFGFLSRRRLSSSYKATMFDFGDVVEFNDSETSDIVGKVIDKRGGWYSIEVATNQNTKEESEITTKIYKRRGKQLKRKQEVTPLQTFDQKNAEHNAKESSPEGFKKSLAPPPTMVDLDSLLLSNIDSDISLNSSSTALIAQAQYISSHFHKWVMFTDLHCSPSTLSTTLNILDTIHETAIRQPNTGVLFLGDFWHHRGSLPIPILNAVLDSLSKWKVPMIMIPGNHDQVTFKGEEHGLSPLRNAYNVDISPTAHSTVSNIIPGPLIFSQPTQFLNATFIPHIRDNGVMESILSSPLATSSSTDAIFVHADVTGAYMNDLIQSQGGVSPRMFPRNKMIYSGHFHKPHVITWKGRRGQKKTEQIENHSVNIEYVGSPYETSLSEAGQQKALQILDSSNGWKCIERIPLNIGTKHYKCNSVGDFINLDVDEKQDDFIKAGDRIVLTLPEFEFERLSSEKRAYSTVKTKHNHDGILMEEQTRKLRDLGAKVEIRTIKPTNKVIASSLPPTMQVEDMIPQSILNCFLDSEVTAEKMSELKKNELRKLGIELLEEIFMPSSNDKLDSKSMINKELKKAMPSLTDLKLSSVTLQGFGCFKTSTEYPLDKRGLVLIRGKNMDGGSDSNGSGKSTLAMSTLWALTGTMDPRPLQDGKVGDVVNDDSKITKVTLKGFINDEPFIIARSKTSSNKSALTFLLNQEDRTTQSVKETQSVIDNCLFQGSKSASQILARVMFQGQHALNGLLEATDAQWKDELALVVPLDIWKEGSSIARKKSRSLKNDAAQISGMIGIREKDLATIRRRYEEAELIKENCYVALREKEELVNREIESLMGNENKAFNEIDLTDSQEKLESASNQIIALETKMRETVIEKENVMLPLQSSLQNATLDISNLEKELEWKKREIDQGRSATSKAKAFFNTIETKWKEVKDGANSIEKCPTCKRPFDNDGNHDHSIESLNELMEEEISGASNACTETEKILESIIQDLEVKENVFADKKRQHDKISISYKEEKEKWDNLISLIDVDMVNARKQQNEQASQVSKIIHQLKKKNEIQSIKINLEAELQKFKDMYASSVEALSSISSESDKFGEQIQELKEDHDSAQYKSKLFNELTDVFGPRGVQSFVLKDAINALELSTQSYLDELSDKSQRLELKLDNSDRLLRKASICFPNGSYNDRPLSSLSGGQWRRCSLALSLGFSELVARRGGLISSLLVLDEPLTHLDAFGREQVGSLLRRMVRPEEGCLGLNFSTILIILQDLAAEELGEESFDFIDEVMKSDGSSRVRLDDGLN